jgi:hypothetical protein
VGAVEAAWKLDGEAGRAGKMGAERGDLGGPPTAALPAVLVALTVSRRITLPVARLIMVARAMGGGDRSARAGDVRGPGELRDLSEAFDQMADSVACASWPRAGRCCSGRWPAGGSRSALRALPLHAVNTRASRAVRTAALSSKSDRTEDMGEGGNG